MTQEEIKYHNRLWYYKTYNQLIDKCLRMEKEGYPEDMYTEIHHILPRCQGGTNKKCNLVRMPARYHIIAHMLLSSAFPNEKGLVFAVNAMFLRSNSNILRENSINKISTRLISRFREQMAKFQENTKLPESQKNKISISMKNYRRKGNSILSVVCHDFENNIVRIYECVNDAKIDGFYSKGIRDSIQNKSKYGGYYFTELSYFKSLHEDKIIEYNNLTVIPTIRKERYSRKGKDTYNSRKIQGPDGTIYVSMSECERKTGHTWNTISKWIKNHPEKGFKFYTEKDNN